MADFPAGYMTPALEPDEMLVGLAVTPWPAGHGHAFVEFARRHGDFAIVSVAVLLLLDDAGCVARASITLGGVAATPVRMAQAEAALLGQPAEPATLARAAALCAAIDAKADSYVPSWYRQRLARVLTERALTQAVARAKESE
ncbi:FAD binding domain-containing protein [Bordetella bronchiseptica]|nr:hypothetical protein [Bordetella bronchiseptica]